MRAKGRRLIALMITAMMLTTNVLTAFAEESAGAEKSQDAPTYTLTVESSGQGSIKITGDETEKSEGNVEIDTEMYQVKAGSEVTVEITPAKGGELSELRLNEETLSSEDGKATFQMPEEDSKLAVKIEDSDQSEGTSDDAQKEVKTEKKESEKKQTEAQEETKEKRTAAYDLDALNAIFDSIDGMGTVNPGIATYASVGQSVEASVLRMDIGSIEMIRYNSDGSWDPAGSWSEGMLGLSNGEWAFCADPNVDFVAGTKTCYNANQFYSEDTIKTIGMMFYYFDTQVKCSGMSDADIYLMKQCVLWTVLDKVNGWMSGITLEYGNGMTDGLGHGLAGHLGSAVWDGASWAADAENRKHFTCSGIIMKGDGQDLSQWNYSYNPQGKLQLHKSSAIPKLTDGNSCYSLTGAVYGVYSDSACAKKVGELTTKSDGV